ncbi:hypothetical protein, conserved [Babesia bigemina]|uniref:Uncharacterized protein n=1 Tax=Babesia bigemina TaxID=5866 RepID=A0A061D8K7_BABBI|nr:hypothetical protein, conserved [Babesia bigemina]CDR95244.1 hypothetical protein, conserved [Babesia bigemina]|eukprot:XP_012767430.1 hypothetical protein, conserved [Babesia bigemina]
MSPSYISLPIGAMHQCGEDDNEEVDFEGWLQVASHNRCMSGESVMKCHSGSAGAKACNSCVETVCCRKHAVDGGHVVSRGDRSCTPRNCVNIVKRQGAKVCRCKGFEVSHAEQDDVFYVNNKQHAPKILVQKPQTVIVRNHSRPPIVVQQPPPNVIVKNDPPQPVYVQNCPPNVVVKNERPSSVLKTPAMPMKFPQVYQSGYPPNYMKPCNCARHGYQ